ncbi:hypothetical protein MTOK_58440 [Mycolicibacterium tokaiense]|nr:hypothetical protein MTOK_58440 [Mycolicibacterium tokaiense]
MAEPFPGAHIDFGGLPRTYVLHVPPGPVNGLVINLHAGGHTGASQQALTHFDGIADAHGFVVAYPDGIDFSWADGRGASVPDRQGVDDVGFISALVNQLVTQFNIDPNRVYATGLSAGAFMANRLACERADIFAAIAPVDGTLGTNYACAPSEPVAVMATHGTADPVVPFNGGPMLGRGGVAPSCPHRPWPTYGATSTGAVRPPRCRCPMRVTACVRSGSAQAAPTTPRWCSPASTAAATPGRAHPPCSRCSRWVPPPAPSTPRWTPAISSPRTGADG